MPPHKYVLIINPMTHSISRVPKQFLIYIRNSTMFAINTNDKI